MTCLEFELGACIDLATLTTESSQSVKLRELLWCQLGPAMCLPRLEIMTGQRGKKCNVCQRKGQLVQMRVPRSGPAQLTLYLGSYLSLGAHGAQPNLG